MLLLEHDAKELLAAHGIPVAAGVLWDDGADLPAGPWVVKAQVPVGGRGKAGGIRMAGSAAEVREHAQALLGSELRGHVVRGVRVEQRVAVGDEAYLSISVDAATGGVRVLMSAQGGVEVEALAGQPGALRSAVCEPDPAAVARCARELAAGIGGSSTVALAAAAARLAPAFFELEALLLEINPLFVADDGSWIAGDAKMIIDENALVRSATLAALVRRRAQAYPEAAFKLAEDFDYVELDRAGQVGLVTTGAGLSMMLVDQLATLGLSTFNFLDIRTGQMRGSPQRLLRVFKEMERGSGLKVLLVNIFAGITHQGEFSRLLLTALDQSPGLAHLPVVARLVGNGQEEAAEVLRRSGRPMYLEHDLDAAVERVRHLAGARPPAAGDRSRAGADRRPQDIR
jgi:succinyl-CoA synthetase beta subunit